MIQAEKKIVLRELKSLREKADLMIYAVLNDEEYPCKNDIEDMSAMEISITIIKDKIISAS